METNEINPKSQSTGGLKLMTVFIAVLALHVVVIGGFTVYHLMSGGGSDADLAVDKVHKDVKVTPDNATVSDGQLPDGINPDKNATAANTPAENGDSASAMTIPAPPAGKDAAPADAGAPAPSASAPAPAAKDVASVAPAPTSSAPSGPMAGPVISPPAGSAPAPAADNATASAPSDAAAAEPASGSNYVVKKGDSLARIARQHHVKVAALRSANGLKSDFLHIGQKLSIPAASVASTASASAPKEKEEGLAKLRQPNTTLLGDSIPNEKPASAHEKIVATGGRHTYTVAKGDTLTRIAHRFHTTSSAIMAMNNITDARKLRLGQKLRIPSQESRSAATSAPEPVAPRAQPVDHIEPRATPTAQLANFVP